MVVVSSVTVAYATGVDQVGKPAPLEVKTWPLEPVEPLTDNDVLKRKVVNVPAKGVVPPIATLSIVDAVAGLIVTVPEPVGARLTFLLAGLANKPPLTVMLPLPPPSQFNRLVPPDVRKLPPRMDCA